jgi:ankyrin repeat protein
MTFFQLSTGLALVFFMTCAGAGPLHDAVDVGNLAKAKHLLKMKSTDVSEVDSRGIWPLLAAASDGNTDMVQLLLSFHAKPNQADQYQYSALHEAASLGFRDVMEILIEAKADINARDINGITPLGYAMRSQSRDAVTLLQEFGATQ